MLKVLPYFNRVWRSLRVTAPPPLSRCLQSLHVSLTLLHCHYITQYLRSYYYPDPILFFVVSWNVIVSILKSISSAHLSLTVCGQQWMLSNTNAMEVDRSLYHTNRNNETVTKSPISSIVHKTEYLLLPKAQKEQRLRSVVRRNPNSIRSQGKKEDTQQKITSSQDSSALRYLTLFYLYSVINPLIKRIFSLNSSCAWK